MEHTLTVNFPQAIGNFIIVICKAAEMTVKSRSVFATSKYVSNWACQLNIIQTFIFIVKPIPIRAMHTFKKCEAQADAINGIKFK